mmetsp:Transcript_40560/g.67358  ORF Transcript_40560/g.67358 Transcript_40560/m.67358 type:complete len:195 (-) Transcript_40560:73-657(-)
MCLFLRRIIFQSKMAAEMDSRLNLNQSNTIHVDEHKQNLHLQTFRLNVGGGFGSMHIFFLASGLTSALLALAGQAYGCSATMRSSGYGENYDCNRNERQLFLLNNLFQLTVWSILMIVAWQKPPGWLMTFLFVPFLVMAAILSFAALLDTKQDSTPSQSPTSFAWTAFATAIWFVLYVVAMYTHKDEATQWAMV